MEVKILSLFTFCMLNILIFEHLNKSRTLLYKYKRRNSLVFHAYIYLARGCERCCTFHYLSWTDSIKPGLQFSFFILVWLLSRDRLFTRISPHWKSWKSRNAQHVNNLNMRRYLITFNIHEWTDPASVNTFYLCTIKMLLRPNVPLKEHYFSETCF